MTARTPAEWHRATVRLSESVADGVRRIEFVHPAAAGAAPGTHVDVRIPVGDAEVVRSYSVVEADADSVTITVLHAARSRGGSAHMHGLDVGDVVHVSGPLQDFPLRIGAPRYVLVAGGIGITALVGMAAQLRAVGAAYDLHYAGTSRARMPYLDVLADLHGGRLHAHVDDEDGRLDLAGIVASVDRDPKRDLVEAYVCGPLGLMDAVRANWATAALPPANLRFETFGAGTSADDRAFQVSVPALGVETRVDAGESMLDALVRAGVPVMYDCLKGECGLCVAEVVAVEGALDHRDVFLSEAQKAEGHSVCLCVSRATGSATGPAPALALAWP